MASLTPFLQKTRATRKQTPAQENKTKAGKEQAQAERRQGHTHTRGKLKPVWREKCMTHALSAVAESEMRGGETANTHYIIFAHKQVAISLLRPLTVLHRIEGHHYYRPCTLSHIEVVCDFMGQEESDSSCESAV